MEVVHENEDDDQSDDENSEYVRAAIAGLDALAKMERSILIEHTAAQADMMRLVCHDVHDVREAAARALCALKPFASGLVLDFMQTLNDTGTPDYMHMNIMHYLLKDADITMLLPDATEIVNEIEEFLEYNHFVDCDGDEEYYGVHCGEDYADVFSIFLDLWLKLRNQDPTDILNRCVPNILKLVEWGNSAH
jgi:hypothetical protein